MENIIGLKNLRENMFKYVQIVQKGNPLIILKRSKPLFKMVPLDYSDEIWEEVVDFTKIKKGGILLDDVLSRL